MADETIVLNLQIDDNQSTQTLNSLNGKLNEMKAKLADTTVGSKAFKALSTDIAKAETKIINATQAMKGLGKEELYGKIGQFAGGLSAAFSGLFLVLGSGNESVVKLQQNLNMAVGIIAAVQGSLEAAAVVTKLFTMAQAALNTVMMANPIGVIIAGVAALAIGVGALVYALSGASDEEKRFAEEMAAANETASLQRASLVKSIQGLADYLTKLRQKGKTEKELQDEALKNARDNAVATAKAVLDSQEIELESIKNSTSRRNVLRKAELIQEINATKTQLTLIESKKSAQEIAYTAAVKQAQDEADARDAANKAESDKVTAAEAATEAYKQLIVDRKNSDKEYFDAKQQLQRDSEDYEISLIQDAAMRMDAQYQNDLKYQKLIWEATAKTLGYNATQTTEYLANQESLYEGHYDLLVKQYQDKYAKQMQDSVVANQKAIDTLLNTSYQNEIDGVMDKYQKVLDIAGIGEDEKNALIIKRDKEIQDIRNKEIVDIANAEQTKVDIVKSAEDKKKAILDKADQERKDKLKKEIDIIARSINLAVSTTMSFATRASDESLQILNDKFNESTLLYKDQLDKKMITQEQYDAKMITLEKQRLTEEKAIKHDAFEKERTAKIISTTIAGIVGAIAQYEAGPLGVILSALVAAETIAAVALIGSEKNPYALGGILNGPSHANGGIATPFGELEGGEAVINKRSTAMYLPQLSAINQAGGGRNFGGTTLNSANSTTATIDDESLQRIVQAVTSIPVINVATETEQINSRIRKIQNKSLI